MTTIFDDRPHPVPPFAYLRWKENYFFVIMDKENDVFGVAHINSEPLFNRTRYTLELNVKGKPFRYANETPLPQEFALADKLSDGVLTVRFIENQKEFQLSCHNDDIDMDLTFLGRYPAFDFSACRYTAPDIMSVQELQTCGLNLPYNHQQQSLRVEGNVELKKAAVKAGLNGLAYRDHSWVMRADTLVRHHVWTGLNFPERAFGVKAIQGMAKAGLWAKEGYVSDADGDRAFTAIDLSTSGDKGGWPELVTFTLKDGLGKTFTIEADVGNRYSDVQLVSEKFEPGKAYNVIETFSPLKLLETGEEGIGLVELGIHDLAR